MALTVNKQWEREAGDYVTSVYFRIKYINHLVGNRIESQITPYLNKEQFEKNNRLRLKYPSEFSINQWFDYNRETDGNDILQFVHDKWKEDIIFYLNKEANSELEDTEPIIVISEKDIVIEI